jgi:LPXTG-motif cell wall-anchored protein
MNNLEEIVVKRRMTILTRSLVAVAALAVVLVTAPPSFAAPTLTVSASQNLQDGQTVTISGAGFEAGLKGIAIGQCREGYVGPGDCNLQGGAKFRDADGSGNVASFDIVVKEKFGAVDCTKETCVIAAGPLPGAADDATVKANTYVIKMSFGAAPAAEPTPSAQPSVAATTAATPTTGDTLPKTGAGDSVPVLLLGATALLAAGAGVMLLVPGRRRAEANR